jgi:hypothetical protein
MVASGWSPVDQTDEWQGRWGVSGGRVVIYVPHLDNPVIYVYSHRIVRCLEPLNEKIH